MRGYCPRCKEYRADNSIDWGIIWQNGRPTVLACICLSFLKKEDIENV